MPITPDTKNWTWVLEKPCDDCGYDAGRTSFDEVPALVRATAARWPARLHAADVRTRPDDTTWSPLEYGAHVRDVFRVFAARLDLMLSNEAPTFPDWDQDATAIADHYGRQDPELVAREIVSAGDAVADAFAAVEADQRGRAGLRSDGSAFTVESLARYFVHDPIHHLHDVAG